MNQTEAGVEALNIDGFKLTGFKVHEIAGAANRSHSVDRRDFYKIVLVTGDMTLGIGDQTIEMNDTFLFFANPHIAHSVVHHSRENKGYACLFTEAFIAGRERKEVLQNSPLFRLSGTPVIPLNSEQAAFVTGIYQKMLAVHKGGYDYKDELLRNCIELIIHEGLSIQPPNGLKQKNAAARITYIFMELLERQFPIESTADPLRLRTAQDFAESLSVHVNYLNRSVKAVTGKPTSVHIADRIATEAKALLQYTNWSVADIAYSLGFEYPTYFNNYFKRVTGIIPKSFRTRKV
jgi:AraC-like DNA-binding protein